jgi:hypothetical protein
VKRLSPTALAGRIFEDLWAIRTFQVQASANPPPLEAEV